MDVAELIGLPTAAFIAGAINAVAGGGSLITFPALVAAGYPARTANVTNTVAIWPAFLGGSLGYREELGRQRRRIAVLLTPCVLGAIAGSAILLSTSEDTFRAIVPFLILSAVVLMLFQERLSAFANARQIRSKSDDHVSIVLQGVMF